MAWASEFFQAAQVRLIAAKVENHCSQVAPTTMKMRKQADIWAHQELEPNRDRMRLAAVGHQTAAPRRGVGGWEGAQTEGTQVCLGLIHVEV